MGVLKSGTKDEICQYSESKAQCFAEVVHINSTQRQLSSDRKMNETCGMMNYISSRNTFLRNVVVSFFFDQLPDKDGCFLPQYFVRGLENTFQQAKVHPAILFDAYSRTS